MLFSNIGKDHWVSNYEPLFKNTKTNVYENHEILLFAVNGGIPGLRC